MNEPVCEVPCCQGWLPVRMSARPARPVTILADKGPAMNSSCYPATHNHLIYAAMGPEQLSFRAAHNGGYRAAAAASDYDAA